MTAPTRAVVHIRPADAYELTLVAASAVAASLSLLSPLLAPDIQSRVLAAALGSRTALVAYDIVVLAGAACVVTGWVLAARALRRVNSSPVLGLQLERAGLLAVGGLMIAYGVAVVAASWHGTFAGAVSAGIGAAHLLRARRIRRDVAAIRVLADRATAGS